MLHQSLGGNGEQKDLTLELQGDVQRGLCSYVQLPGRSQVGEEDRDSDVIHPSWQRKEEAGASIPKGMNA